MYIYAGIDEAGYGPMFGPLLVARSVFAIENLDAGAATPQLWQRLNKAVSRDLLRRKGRIVISDSKKVYNPKCGLEHLERGVLAFAALAGHRPADAGELLSCLGEAEHERLGHLPWYEATVDRPWQAVPCQCTRGEIAVARSMLCSTAERIGVQVPQLAAAVVFEDRFNEMVAATRSKAATSFTFVAAHLQAIWQAYGEHEPVVVVDRQSGRSHYRELLALYFPEVELTILEESQATSVYRLRQRLAGGGHRAMTVSFEVAADDRHMPVALASMVSKYVRELLMARFQTWFSQHAPDIRPTAGYATDARRFWDEIEPRLNDLAIDRAVLRRTS